MKLSDLNIKITGIYLLSALFVIVFTLYLYFTQRSYTQRFNGLAEREKAILAVEEASRDLLDLVSQFVSIGGNTVNSAELSGKELRLLQQKFHESVTVMNTLTSQVSNDELLQQVNAHVDREVFNKPAVQNSDLMGAQNYLRQWFHQNLGEVHGIRQGLVNQSQGLSSTILVLAIMLFLLTLSACIHLYNSMFKSVAAMATTINQSLDNQTLNGPPLLRLHRSVNKLLTQYDDLREAKFIVNSITEGLIIVSPEGQIKATNNSILSMLGYREDELIGRNFSDIYVKVKSVHVQGFFKRKQTYKEEELFKTREGKVIPVRFSSSFLFDTDMEVIGFVCIAKDITKEKQAEEELQKQSDWFKVTLASIGDGVITCDNDGQVNFMNEIAANLTGWNGDEALDKNLGDVFKVVDRTTNKPIKLPTARQLLMEPDMHQPQERFLIRKDSSRVAIDKIFAPIRSSKGKLHGAVVIFRDMTDIQNQAEELLQSKEKAEAALRVKSQFLANMSHEIRTPMNGIIGMTDLLLETQLSAEQRDVAEVVRGSGESLLTLINDVLDFSKIEAGRLELDEVEFEVRSTLESVGDLLAQKAHEKGLELVLLIHHNTPYRLNGDPGRLRQVLLNLVTNAIKFTDEGEIVVELSLEEESDTHCRLRFDIIDTGVGISNDRMKRLFKPFSQADTSTTRKYGGTGLGLAISKELVEAMDGIISVQSNENKGSTFSFTCQFKLGTATASSQKYHPPKDLNNISILIAEDNANNRKALRYQLEHALCMVEEVENGSQIIPRLIKAHQAGDPFKLLILDFNIGEIATEDLARQIRKDPRISNMGLLLISSIPVRMDASKNKTHAFDGYLTKPVKLNQLYDSLRAILGFIDGSSQIKDHELVTHQYLSEQDRVNFNILVAEDNLVNQKVTASLLKKAGYRCDIAQNGKEVLEALSRMNYHLVLMDCMMPEMDGYQATREIRRMGDKYKDLPIIAMTANALKGDREECLNAGMNEYLSKPVKKQILFETLTRFLTTDEN